MDLKLNFEARQANGAKPEFLVCRSTNSKTLCYQKRSNECHLKLDRLPYMQTGKPSVSPTMLVRFSKTVRLEL